MQAPEIDALLEIDLRGAWSLQRAMPTMKGFEIVFVDGQKFGLT
jgi:hypothetical protein